MKLIIQIPCYNEEGTLKGVIKDFPKKIDGISEIETQIIDDGSSDNTIKVAKECWVTYVLKHKKNRWLWEAFKTWVDNALKNNADILVNTDWDNQYPSVYIKDLVKPIVEKKADMVLWDRQTSKIEHFSILKKFFQFFGSFVVRFLSGVDVPDSVSWFRAYSRESIYRLNITSTFSYAVDTLIQAWKKWLKVDFIKIKTNPPTRPSRLFKNMFDHIFKTAQIILRVYAMYNPLKIFFSFWVVFFFIWFAGISRFLYYYFSITWDTWKIQSLVLSWVFIILAFQFFALWVIWDLIAKNRKLIEDNLYLNKKNYYER